MPKANPSATTELPPPVLGNENTPDLVSPKEQELREENQRLIEQNKKSQERRDQLIEQNNRLESRITALEKALDDERAISSAASFADDDPLQSPLPSMKEIYLQIVNAIAPSLTIGDKLNEKFVKDSAAHAVGLAQVFYTATRQKFLPKVPPKV